MAGADDNALVATPTADILARRLSNFSTLGEALDYAAKGRRGLNFFDARARLSRVLSYSDLRVDATANAYRLIASGIGAGDRVALIAETSAEFVSLFFGAIYAGALPVPLPLPTSFGGREGYVEQIRSQLMSCDPDLVLAPSGLAGIVSEAAQGLRAKTALDWLDFMARPVVPADLPQAGADDIAYLQYSSGSTRFPHGVEITHRALLANLNGHAVGVRLQDDDRVVSWLPFYHDMGLVGCLLSPVANQVSADYLATEDFARRPLSWLALITRNEGHTLSYSPTFGYDICARRVSSQTDVAERFDLSRWRVAGNGADMIRPDVMSAFVEAFGAAGFSAKAFLPSYGLAEATLAVTICAPGTGIVTELVDEALLSGDGGSGQGRMRAIVNCGVALPGMQIEIRSEAGAVLGDKAIGKVIVRGPSIMTGYFRDELSTRACLSGGWLDTGDMGFMVAGSLFIVGRAKDMIIINGKNHWPQDIEWAIEQLPGFKAGDIAAFSITTESGEEAPAVLVQCRTSDIDARAALKEAIKSKVRAITGMNCIVELVPPRTLPRTSSGKLSRSKARALYLSGQIQTFDIAA
jgi:fatty-acyl-CoA synthase